MGVDGSTIVRCPPALCSAVVEAAAVRVGADSQRSTCLGPDRCDVRAQCVAREVPNCRRQAARHRRRSRRFGRRECPPLGRVERLVLAATVSQPGLCSVAAVAAAAGVSWSAARHALHSLSARSAIRFRTWKQTWRDGIREVGAWEPDVASEDFEELLAQTAYVNLPLQSSPAEHSGTLPSQHWHLFWDHPDPSALRVPDDAAYVANRLLNGPSASAAIWAAARLPEDALGACVSLRSTQPATRALIKNSLAHRRGGSR